MTRAGLLLPLAAGLLAAAGAAAQETPVAALCPSWSDPEVVGLLDTDLLSEASGLEISARFPGRLYHNNDSGDGPYFYVTDLAAGETQRVTVDLFAPRDVEDIALGPCGGETCLFIADIGDNARLRRRLEIVIVEEAETFSEPAAPRAIVTAAYPDGAHNAEAAAAHPNGDLYVLTKTDDRRRDRPARLYRMRAAQLAEGGEQTFAYVAEIDLPAMGPDGGGARRVATAMDIAGDGSRAVVLTYGYAVEIAADFVALSEGDPERWRAGEDYRVIPTATLPQAEAVAYSADARAILYDTESVRGSPAPMVLQTCVE